MTDLNLLDIIFQSNGTYLQEGGMWWKDILNTFIGAVIGTGGTIWALYKTFRHDKKKDRESRLQFQKEKIRYFKSLIISTDKSLKAQITHLGEFVDKVGKDAVEIPLLTQTTFNALEQIVHKLNQEDYYHSYLGEFPVKESVEEFRKMILLLNYFDGNLSLMKSSLQKAVEYDYQRKVHLKELMEKSLNDIAGLLIDEEIIARKEFWNFLNATLATFFNNRKDASDLRYYHDNFIVIIKAGLIEFAKTIPKAHNILIQVHSASLMFTDIMSQNIFLAKEFEKLQVAMNENYVKFQEQVKNLMTFDN